MSALHYLRVLRNKLVGLPQTTNRLDSLDTRINELTGQLSTLAEQLRALHNDDERTREDIAALHADVTAQQSLIRDLPQQHDSALQDLADRIGADTTALFGRHANLFHARPPRAPTPPRSAANAIERIGFLVHSKELLNHYGCVWDLMPEGSFDVVLHGTSGLPQPADLTRWKCNVTSTRALLDADRFYRVLVSNHPVSDHGEPLIKRLGQTNVRFMYAAGKSGWNLSAWNRLYDVVMCFGPYHALNFSQASDAIVVQMGYPRFDRFFNDHVDREALARAQGCNPAKQTIVWLPTQGAISSLGHFDAEIGALTDRYNVIVKVHPLTPTAEPGRIEALKRLGLTRVITDSEDNLPLYQLADFMLFDYGGPPLAGIYTDKRMVLLNVPGAADDSLTGDDSPDVSIRKHLVNIEATDNALAALLADETTWTTQQHARRTLRSLYFAPHHGFSSHVAAQTLLNVSKLLPGEI